MIKNLSFIKILYNILKLCTSFNYLFYSIAGEMRFRDILRLRGMGRSERGRRKKESRTRPMVRLLTKPNLRPFMRAFTRVVWIVTLAAMALREAIAQNRILICSRRLS